MQLVKLSDFKILIFIGVFLVSAVIVLVLFSLLFPGEMDVPATLPQEIQDAVESNETVSTFLQENTGAVATARHFEQSNFPEIQEEIGLDCNMEEISEGEFYRVEFTDQATAKQLIAWVNAETQEIECLIEKDIQLGVENGNGGEETNGEDNNGTTGDENGTTNGETRGEDDEDPGLEPPPATCIKGWKCKDPDIKAFQKVDCSWEQETECDYLCADGNCIEEEVDPCEEISCDSTYCEGSVRYYDGRCSLGNCIYDSIVCDHGCQDGLCEDVDPCERIACLDTCEGSTLNSQGECITGSCSYSTSTDCSIDYCNGITRYFNGQCSGGQCTYSTEECGNACENGQCIAYGCESTWPQKVTNTVSGQKLWVCPSQQQYCKTGTGQCCNYNNLTQEYYDCVDCTQGNCVPVNCEEGCNSYCENAISFHSGSCVDGNCQHSSTDCGQETSCEGDIKQYGGGCRDGDCYFSLTQDCDVDSCSNNVAYSGGNCSEGQCQYTTTSCPYGCDGTGCKEYHCYWDGWPQSITHKSSGEIAWECISGKWYCQPGTTNCCNYNSSTQQYYDCIDCREGGCIEADCAGVSCNGSCENGILKYNGECVGGECQFETGTCIFGCENSWECKTQGIVFVSSIQWNGNLGGIDGADTKCQARAVAAGLLGEWEAMVSTSSVHARNRVPDTFYKRTDGLVIANNKTELFSAPYDDLWITKNEFGEEHYVEGPTSHQRWTGSTSTGYATSYNCNNWTSSSSEEDGTKGTGYLDNWLDNWVYPCDYTESLLCMLIGLDWEEAME